ncbi:MAG: hypothetical protein GY820_22465 [Gammaproteobacteria bacterium]|nr:hypothetical protein [Gammaproteobacteria bacterium]
MLCRTNTGSGDWKIRFLHEFAYFLQLWKDSGARGLTTETFLATRHTCDALADAAEFCLNRLGLNYVLLGAFQSDPLESRFGWYRQLSGANYYISVKQLVESERKIRALSLAKFSTLSIKEMDKYLENVGNNWDKAAVEQMAIEMSSAAEYEADLADVNAIFYVAGALVRSELRQNKCQFCPEILLESDDPLQVDLPGACFVMFKFKWELLNRSFKSKIGFIK